MVIKVHFLLLVSYDVVMSLFQKFIMNNLSFYTLNVKYIL